MRHRLSVRLAFLTLACAAAHLASANPLAGRALPEESAVDAIFKRHDNKNATGCSVAVVKADAVVLNKSYGMADPSLGVPRTSSTSNWIPYSEARVFVALAVAMLARDGKISLDDSVRTHVPQVPAYANAVTIRQLLHHTSGLADYGILAGPGFELHDRLSEDEFFRILTRWNKLGFVAGSGRMYSNTDYALLKILVERITGGSLHAWMESTLLRRLGMSATRIGSDQSAVQPSHALFHELHADGLHRLLRYRVSPVGGIAVSTSLDDLVRWDAALRDPALGLGKMLKGLESGAPAPQAESEGESFAFGVHRRTHAGLPVVEYHGVGDFTYLLQVPSADLSVITLCNGYEGTASYAADVAALYAGNVATSNPMPTPASTTQLKPAAAVPVPLEELRRYVGEYRDAQGRPMVDVTMVNGALVVSPRGRPSFPGLVALGNGRFAIDGPYQLEFSPAVGDGMALASTDKATGESGGPVLQRWRPVPPTANALRSYPGIYIGEDVELILHVRVDGTRVLLASRGMEEAELSPEGTPDAFHLPEIYSAHFERDAKGSVTALVLDANRVKGMRFRYSPASSSGWAIQRPAHICRDPGLCSATVKSP